MNRQPFIFIKGYKERLDDFTSILSSDLKACEIKKQWSNYLELTIEPAGWEAIWNMSRNVCTVLKIQFPFIVIVAVEQVNFIELSCLVSIKEVENDNIQLPEKMADVPLVELYPTLAQNNMPTLLLRETANTIDCLRFFYNHLWMPWDLEVDEDTPWVECHLRDRLQLHMSMVERRVPPEVGDQVRSLVSEGRRMMTEMEDLQEQLAEHAEDYPAQLLQLTRLHHRMASLRSQYSIYENPLLLDALVNEIKSREEQQSTFLVLSMRSPDRFLQLANTVAGMSMDNSPIRFSLSLKETLAKAHSGSTIWLTEGEHPIQDLVGHEIKGVEPGVVLTVITTLDTLCSSLTLSALTLRTTNVWNIIKVRPEVQCRLQDVKLEGCSVTDGVDVYSGASLIAHNCHFSSCNIAIICSSNTTVALYNCIFTDNNVALQLNEGCNFSMKNCSISGSMLYGVQIIASSPNIIDNNHIGSINSIPEMQESGTVCMNNATDLYITKKTIKYDDITHNGFDNPEPMPN